MTAVIIDAQAIAARLRHVKRQGHRVSSNRELPWSVLEVK